MENLNSLTESSSEMVPMEVRIAGIHPISVSNEKPTLYFSYKTLSDQLETFYTRSLSEIPPKKSMKDDDYRYPYIVVGLEADVPSQKFYISKELVNSVVSQESDLTKEVTENELLRIGLSCKEGAVREEFSSDALNDVNKLYYSLPDAFADESGLATMYVENPHLNQAIARLIKDLIPKESLVITELACGTRAIDKWQLLALELLDRQLHILLTDFSEPAIPNVDTLTSQMPNLTVGTSKYSVFDSLSTLSRKQTNITMISYGFDSVWLPEDVRYRKYKGKWYKVKLRVKATDWHSKRKETIQSLRTGETSNDVTISDLKHLVIEEAVEEISNIESVPFGKCISEEYNDVVSVSINFPGGLIKRVVEAFDTCLAEDGVFIVCDVAKFKKDQKVLQKAFNTSGIAAKYKIEDYTLAKRVLESKFGLKVDFLSLDELADRYLDEEWIRNASEREINQITKNPSNCIMIISKSD